MVRTHVSYCAVLLYGDLTFCFTFILPSLHCSYTYILHNHAMKSFTHGIKDESEQRSIEFTRFGAPGTMSSPEHEFFLLCYVLHVTTLLIYLWSERKLLLCSSFVWRFDILLYVYPPLITLQLYIYLHNHAMKSFTGGCNNTVFYGVATSSLL